MVWRKKSWLGSNDLNEFPTTSEFKPTADLRDCANYGTAADRASFHTKEAPLQCRNRRGDLLWLALGILIDFNVKILPATPVRSRARPCFLPFLARESLENGIESGRCCHVRWKHHSNLVLCVEVMLELRPHGKLKGDWLIICEVPDTELILLDGRYSALILESFLDLLLWIRYSYFAREMPPSDCRLDSTSLPHHYEYIIPHSMTDRSLSVISFPIWDLLFVPPSGKMSYLQGFKVGAYQTSGRNDSAFRLQNRYLFQPRDVKFYKDSEIIITIAHNAYFPYTPSNAREVSGAKIQPLDSPTKLTPRTPTTVSLAKAQMSNTHEYPALEWTSKSLVQSSVTCIITKPPTLIARALSGARKLSKAPSLRLWLVGLSKVSDIPRDSMMSVNKTYSNLWSGKRVTVGSLPIVMKRGLKWSSGPKAQ
ncbi:uncharacterized protein BDR25DRAFT_358340 [Lindgomyces ingoldianus]|uniref:Uncharacterized protein n=1 Tax=Lindgomyces ingoldianus TaxID=673940 RepID=A0ACB6QKX4_9PLEO|nr:uncharacterized protein BDR25DRAFT_358340 [Lindgomyces ingoldianus]KAF2467653.1 hypothetical protein BDR25DRAFT_358340 [Lindgomyces ingoldianus]